MDIVAIEWIELEKLLRIFIENKILYIKCAGYVKVASYC